MTVTISSDEDEEPSAEASHQQPASSLVTTPTAQDDDDAFFPFPVSKPTSFGTLRRHRMEDAVGAFCCSWGKYHFERCLICIVEALTRGYPLFFKDHFLLHIGMDCQFIECTANFHSHEMCSHGMETSFAFNPTQYFKSSFLSVSLVWKCTVDLLFFIVEPPTTVKKSTTCMLSLIHI